VLLEGVGDVFEEDEAEDDVLVFRRVHVVAQLVGGEPELGLEAEVGGGIVLFAGCFRHQFPFCYRGILADLAAQPSGRNILNNCSGPTEK